MAVVRIEKSPAAAAMTIVCEFDAPVERVWGLWADPRQLERWWGPPGYPATFVDHELAPGGRASYFMTGPDGATYHGWWRVTAVDAPRALELEDGFADDAGRPDPGMPVTVMRVRLERLPGDRTRMELASQFPSPEAMAQLEAMGIDEGITQALGQADALLGG